MTSRKKIAPGSKARQSLTDMGLGVAGVGLALASLYFPWHVYWNQDQVTLPRLEFSGNTEIYGEPEDRIAVRGYLPQIAGQVLDPTVTGSTTRDEGPDKQSNDAGDRPAPQRLPGYRLLHSANGLALVRDENSIFVVGRNSELPDGGHVKSIRRIDGGWQVLTSQGGMIAAQ